MAKGITEEEAEILVEENLKNGFKQDQLLVTGIPIGEHFATPLDKIETRKKLNEILAANTGQPLSVIEVDTERDHYMSAAEAAEYGLIDAVLEKR